MGGGQNDMSWKLVSKPNIMSLSDVIYLKELVQVLYEFVQNEIYKFVY